MCLHTCFCVKSLHLNTSWLINCMRKADKNKDDKMTLKELKHFLRQINIEVDDSYAEELFKVSPSLVSKIILYKSVLLIRIQICPTWLTERLIWLHRNVTRPIQVPWRTRRSHTSTNY